MLILHRYYLKIKFIPHRKNCVPIAKNIWVMRYGEVIASYYGSYSKHVKWAKFRNIYVAAGGRPIKQWTLRGCFLSGVLVSMVLVVNLWLPTP